MRNYSSNYCCVPEGVFGYSADFETAGIALFLLAVVVPFRPLRSTFTLTAVASSCTGFGFHVYDFVKNQKAFATLHPAHAAVAFSLILICLFLVCMVVMRILLSCRNSKIARAACCAGETFAVTPNQKVKNLGDGLVIVTTPEGNTHINGNPVERGSVIYHKGAPVSAHTLKSSILRHA